MEAESFDVVILGAGSGGELLATSLAEEGRSVAIVEQRLVGGECPFFACMPSKAMIRSAEVRHLLDRAAEQGATGAALDPGPPDAGWARAVARRDGIINGRDDGEHAAALTDAGVSLVRGRARLAGAGLVEVAAGEVRRLLRGADVVIATGTTPTIPPIDGLGDVDAWTSDRVWTGSERPATIIVLGGGPVGCEIAQVHARFGVQVTIVEATERIAGGEEAVVSDALIDIFRDEGITVALGASAERVEAEPGGVRLHLDDGSRHSAERLILAVGRTPAIGGIGLEALDLPADEPLDVEDDGRVRGAAHLWAVGDVTGIAPFTHMANAQARVVAAQLLGGADRVDAHAVPRAIYTDPPVAGVGLTAVAARAAGRHVEVAEMDLADTARHAADDGPGGRVVLVADAAAGVLIGASAVGPAAPEWMGQLVLAVHARIPLAVLAEVIQPFPTYAEALQPLLGELRDRCAV